MSVSVHPLAIGPRDVTPQVWFVDSVAGSDNNSGGSANSPLQTIAAVLRKPLVQGCAIYVARGSYFREQIDGLPAFARVEAYGSGARPVFDCSDVALNANFTKTGGQTNVYQVSWAHSINTAGKGMHSLWENGARLTRATSVANCDATPGSFYAAAPTAGPDTVYVHPTGSTSPITNGRTYELAARNYGVSAPSAIGVHTRRNGHNDGSLIATYAKDCLAEDGTVHNAWNAGLFEDVTAWNCEGYAGAGSSTMFVSYEDTTNSLSVEYRRCRAVNDSYKGGALGFYAHTDGTKKWKRVVYEDCFAGGVQTGWSSANVERAVYIRCTTRTKVTWAIVGAPDVMYVLGCSFVAADRLLTRGVAPTSGKVFLRGTTILSGQTSGALVWTNDDTDIRRCIVGLFNPVGGAYQGVRVDTGTLSYVESISYAVAPHFSCPAIGEHRDNIWWQDNAGFTIGGNNYATATAYKTANATEANSQIADPLFNAIRNGDTSVGPTSPVWTLAASAALVGAGPSYETPDFVLEGLIAYARSLI